MTTNAAAPLQLIRSEIGSMIDSVAGEIAKGTKHFAFTDMGNGDRFVARHGDNTRYVTEAQMWYVWDGTRWREDRGDHVQRLAEDTVLAIREENYDTREQQRLAIKHAQDSQSNGQIEAMLKRARIKLPIPADYSMFDSDPYLLNVKNGTLDLRTGRLHEHRRGDHQTKMAGAAFDEDAKCPTFESFLSNAQGGRKENLDYIRRVAGYSMTGDVHEKCLFFIHGRTDTGKTLFLETLRHVMGEYAGTTPTDTLAAKGGRTGRIPNDLARLRGLRLVMASESEQGDFLHESLVKQLTGGDTIVARFLNKEFFEFTPVCKFFFATNHLPRFHGGDSALERRIRLIPFNVQVPQREQDPQLRVRLREEAAGILAWMVRGCLEWQEQGIAPPGEVVRAVRKIVTDNDDVGQFLDEKCVAGVGFEEARSTLYQAYSEWSKAGNRNPLNNRNFQGVLESRGFFTDGTRKRFGASAEARHYWRGLRLRTEFDDDTTQDTEGPADQRMGF